MQMLSAEDREEATKRIEKITQSRKQLQEHQARLDSESKWVQECIANARKAMLAHAREADAESPEHGAEKAGETARVAKTSNGKPGSAEDKSAKRSKRENTDNESEHFVDADDEGHMSDVSQGTTGSLKAALKKDKHNSKGAREKCLQLTEEALEAAMARAQKGESVAP